MPGIPTIWSLLLASVITLAAGNAAVADDDPNNDAVAISDETEEADDEWVVVDEPDDEDMDDEDDGDEDGDDDGDANPAGQTASGQSRHPVHDARFLPPPPLLPVVARPKANAAASSGAASANNAGAPDRSGGRSFGGVQVKDGGAPWQVEIFLPFPAEKWEDWARKGKELWELQHWCGGALIATDWVLTAAHCVDMPAPPATAYHVRVGAEDISRDNGIVFKVDRAVVHPGFATRNKSDRIKHPFFDDIALLHIVPLTSTQPMPDPAQVRVVSFHRGPPPPDDEPVTVTGWGKTQNVEGTKPSALLLRVDLNVVKSATCAGLPDYGADKIHPNIFCAGAPNRKTCRGDSGGPVVFKNGKPVVVGIVSWGLKECSGDGQPGVYTRVGAYSQWIDSTIRGAPLRP